MSEPGTSNNRLRTPVLRPAGRLAASWLACALTMNACAVGPNYRQPQAETPPSWSELATRIDSANVSADLTTWWRRFDDGELSALIERAIRSNHELRIATARVREARAARAVAAGGRWPELRANISAARLRASEHGTLSGLTEVPIDLGDIPLPGEEINLFRPGFDASWEIDLFGYTRRTIERADALFGAAIERRRDVLVSLLAEVARNYVELRALQRRIDVARANVQVQAETLELIRQRRDAGMSSGLELAQARTQLERTRAQLPILQNAATRSIHRIRVLVGTQPGTAADDLSTHHPLPKLPEGIALGLPSTLLERRPDVRAAERELAAATAAVGVATADLFPRFSLSAALGLESQTVADLGRVGSTAWALTPAMRWPVFDAGRARAMVRVEDARAEQALARFEQQVLSAFEDVENASTAYVHARQRTRAFERAATAAGRATALARALHASGLTDFLTVLDSERTSQQVEDELATSRGEELLSVVRIYKSLGGGWQTPSR